MSSFAFAVVLLAAGASSRMGTPKLLLPWGSSSILASLIERWKSLGAAQIAVVLAAGDKFLSAELDRMQFVQEARIANPNPARGMFSSLLCAAQWPGWEPQLTHWVISLGDQPHVRTQTFSNLLEQGRAYPEKICQPARNGRGRHPVLLPKAAFLALRDSVDAHLKDFLAKQHANRIFFEADDAGLDFDLDEPAHYELAVEMFMHEEGRS